MNIDKLWKLCYTKAIKGGKFMAIITNLDEKMRVKGYSLAQLAEEIGISPVNLSKIKNGNISAMRFSTLDEICRVLECQPGDILKYEEKNKKKLIPLLLDYSGTTDLLLKGGAEAVKKFFDSIKAMEQKLGTEIRAVIITGSAVESAKSKYEALTALAENSDLPHLFDGAVAEYCGYLVRNGKIDVLNTLDPRILEKRNEIEEIVKKYGGEINTEVLSLYNVGFEDVTRENLAKTAETVEKLLNNSELETVTYYDDYGKEFDIKPKKHSKVTAVRMVVDKWREKYEIPFVIIGGDSQDEDLKMYSNNKEYFAKNGLMSVFIAPSNIGKLADYDENIIVSNWENSNGIADAIDQLTKRAKVKEEGEIEL